MEVSRVDVGSMFADPSPQALRSDDDEITMDPPADAYPAKKLPDDSFEMDDGSGGLYSSSDSTAVALRQDLDASLSAARQAAAAYEGHLSMTKKRRKSPKRKSPKRKSPKSTGQATAQPDGYVQMLEKEGVNQVKINTENDAAKGEATRAELAASTNNDIAKNNAATQETTSQIKDSIKTSDAATTDRIKDAGSKTEAKDDERQEEAKVIESKDEKEERQNSKSKPSKSRKRSQKKRSPKSRGARRKSRSRRSPPQNIMDPVEARMIAAQNDAGVARTKQNTEDDVSLRKRNTQRALAETRNDMSVDMQEGKKHAQREVNQRNIEKAENEDGIATAAADTQAKIDLIKAEKDAEIARLEAETRRSVAVVQFQEDLMGEARKSVRNAVSTIDESSSESDSSGSESESESDMESDFSDYSDDYALPVNGMTYKRPDGYAGDEQSVDHDVLEYQALLNNFDAMSDSELSELSDMSDGALAREEQHLTELLRELDTYEKKSQPLV